MRFPSFILFGASLFIFYPSSPAETLAIASAADLKFAMEDCVGTFRMAHPDTEVKVIYGSSGNLCAQIANGAPFDLFLSADKKFPDALIAEGHAVADSLFSYALGRLVVWVPKDSPIDAGKLGMASLKEPSAKKIAIANPDHAPYGQAAVAAMKSLGVYEDVKPRLVLGENVAQTAQFVESGAADLGIIALSLAMAPVMSEKGRFWEVPRNTFPPLIQSGVITRQAENSKAAAQFTDFLRSPAGREILKNFGFVMPGGD